MHQRKLIRHAVAAVLVNATAAGARVKPTRVEPQRKGDMPAIGVYTLSETSDTETDEIKEPREILRQLQLEVVGWVLDGAAAPVDDAMDDLAEQIELAMDLDRYFGGAAAESILVGTSMQVLSDDGADPLIGVVTLTYAVTYRTSPAVTAGADEFLRADVTTQIDGAGDDNTASDLFDVRA